MQTTVLSGKIFNAPAFGAPSYLKRGKGELTGGEWKYMMERTALLNNKKGFTLVEVMIAMIVSLLVFFALMLTALVSIDSNMRNNLRDEAANIAAMRMRDARNLLVAPNLISDTVGVGTPPAVDISGNADCPTTPAPFAAGVLERRNFRNIPGFTFCTNRTVVVIAPDARQVTIRVGWRWKDVDYNHNISTVVGR
ncbi:MAG: hypothetical protein CVV37_05860 [Nitrospira bacterium HGW-Nitrospira-1]|nr:MAG: hypothetical protein CVV37_05860 [Nitrospira bacterium HGW-Nitrospira-1]